MKKDKNTASCGWSKPKTLLACISLVLSIGFAGAAQPLSDKGDHVVTGGDLAFMNDAGPGSMAEVELGQLAVERAASARVKQFAQQMIKDHSKAGEDLKQLAQQKKVTLPPGVLPKAKQTKENLSKLNGEQFDREYVKVMVEVHEKDVAAFDAVAKNATDADVKAFAAATAPTLKHHLQMIREIAKSLNVQVK